VSFSTTINTLMTERNWKAAHLVAALADRGVDVVTPTVERWMRGATTPRSEVIPVIAAILDTTTDFLLTGAHPNSQAV